MCSQMSQVSFHAGMPVDVDLRCPGSCSVAFVAKERFFWFVETGMGLKRTWHNENLALDKL